MRHGFLTREGGASASFFADAEGTFSYALAEACNSLESLIDAAIAARVTHLWVMPAYGLEIPAEGIRTREIEGAEKLDNPAYDCIPNMKAARCADGKTRKMLVSAVGRQLAPLKTSNVRIIMVLQSAWPWPRDITVGQARALVNRMQFRLKVPVQASPATTGRGYLDKLHENRFSRYFARPAGLDTVPWLSASKVMVWQRKPEGAELQKGLILAIDRRSWFPRCAEESNFGYGDFAHVKGPAFNHLLPGIWRAEIKGLDQIDARIPAPLWRGADWLSTPVVKSLIKLGCKVEPREAYIFPRYTKLFARWASNLWDMRREALNEIENASYKAIMNNTLGLSRSKLIQSSLRFRPDYTAQFVGQARAGMIYNAMRYVKLTGVYPWAIYIDAAYYLIDSLDELPGILDYENSLGGYALKWIIPFTGQAREIVTSSAALAKKLQALNEIAELASAA